MRYDSIVIGSGASGLTAALALARNGRKVALVEKHEHVAPLLTRFRRGEVWCDPGLHYVGGLCDSGPLTVLLRYLGAIDRVRAKPLNVKGFDVVRLDEEEEVAFPCGLSNVEEALSQRFPESRRAIVAYVQEIRRVFQTVPFASFARGVDAFSYQALPAISLRDFLVSYGAEGRLIDLLGTYGYALYGVEALEAPMLVHALVQGSFFHSAHVFDSGGDEIAGALRDSLVENGADIYCGCKVKGLLVDDFRRLQGVELEGGERLETNSCLSTVHPKILADLLPPAAVRPAYLARLRSLEDTFSPFTIYLDVPEPLSRITRSNCYLLDSRDLSWPDRCLAIMACPPDDDGNGRRSVCVFRPCVKDMPPSASRRRSGGREQIYQEYKERITQEAVARVCEAVPELRGQFRVVETASPLTYEDYTGTYRGAAYGVKQGLSQLRLSGATRIQGLLLAGQSLNMPGLLGSMISGILAVANLIGRDRVWNAMSACR